MCVYIYTYICMCIYIYIYIYTHTYNMSWRLVSPSRPVSFTKQYCTFIIVIIVYIYIYTLVYVSIYSYLLLLLSSILSSLLLLYIYIYISFHIQISSCFPLSVHEAVLHLLAQEKGGFSKGGALINQFLSIRIYKVLYHHIIDFLIKLVVVFLCLFTRQYCTFY